jgi:hypothetical protein
MVVPKFVSVVLMLVMLLQCSIVLIVWQVKIEAFHERNWDKETTDEAVQMALTYDEFEQGRINEHEVRIDQKIYDIRQIEWGAEKVELMVVYDEEEQSILNQIAGFFSPRTGRDHTSPGILPILFLYYQQPQVFRFYLPVPIREINYAVTPDYHSFAPVTVSPPPERTPVS